MTYIDNLDSIITILDSDVNGQIFPTEFLLSINLAGKHLIYNFVQEQGIINDYTNSDIYLANGTNVTLQGFKGELVC